MPRNFSELKSGGTIPMLSPHAEKWGDASPRPPPIDARVCIKVDFYYFDKCTFSKYCNRTMPLCELKKI